MEQNQYPRELQMMKELLPFINQRALYPTALLLQALEIQYSMQNFKKNTSTLSAMSIPQDSDRKNAILQRLKKFCTPKEKEMIDTILNVMCVMENTDLMT